MRFNKKLPLSIIILSFLLVLVIPIDPSLADNSSWNEHWSYIQQLSIPIDTTLEQSTHQPVDISVEFTSPCWAKDERHHSIRICTLYENHWYELESQIYNLKRTETNHAESCHVVFLIPDFIDGTEKYYIYYDEGEKPAPQYTDHVSISESYYRYEPISGYPLESSYYKITDDGIIPYIVSQEGQFMGYNTGQHVTKMVENATQVLPKYGDLFAAFDFKYCYDDGVFDYSSTSQQLLNKEVFVDGNLMISFGMISTSKYNDLKTTVHYKYYHCPTSTTRMRVNVRHEAIKDIKTLKESNTDGVFASIQSGGVKSNSIQDLNIGSILPHMHFINEFNEIYSYDLDRDPEYIPENPDIRVVSYKDDVDLGQQPWVSFDEGNQGLVHAILFHSNKVLQSGRDERDGLQLNAFQMDYPHLPGLENNIATVQLGRNSYEPDSGHDITIPRDLIVEFDAEFFTSRTGGFNAVKKESTIYNKIIDETTQINENYNNEEDDIERYTVTVNVHLTPSFPLGSSLSAVTGLNLSFLTVELYENDEYLSSGSAVRIPMNSIDQHAQTILEKIKGFIGIIDYTNISLRKRVVFSDIEPGKYTLKIFLENAGLSNDRKYIGFATVNVTEDTSITLRGSREQTISLTLIDQNQEKITNATVKILKDSNIVSQGMTNEQGEIRLFVPQNAIPYKFEISIHDIVCYNEPVDLHKFQLRKHYEEIVLERYDLEIRVKDSWSLPPGIDLAPILLDQKGNSLGYAERISSGFYQFESLPSGIYTTVLQYKSFTMMEELDLQQDTTLSLTFPALYTVNLTVLDNHGLLCSDVSLLVKRAGKETTFETNSATFSIKLPPGTYTTSVYQENNLINKRTLMVSTDITQDFITNKGPLYPVLIYITLFCIVCILLYYFYRKHILFEILTILPVFLLLASLISPWWIIQGSTDTIETITSLYILPAKMITLTSTSTFISGEQAYLPDLFIMMIYGIIGMILFSSLLITSLFLLQRKHKKHNNKTLLLRLISTIFLIGTISIFVVGMSTLSEITVGTFFGKGILTISTAGQTDFTSISCNWGPSSGFYLLLLSTIITSISLVIHLFKRNKEKNDSKTH